MTTFNKIYKYSRIWILLVAAIFLPKFMPNRYYQGVVNTALIFAILSMSLNTLSGCTGLFCVGFVAFYGIGAYGVYGDITAVSAAGRVFTILSNFVGIAVIALPAGVVTAGYLEEMGIMDKEKKKEEKSED